MVADIARKYKTLIYFIPELIDVSGYRDDYLAKKLGLPLHTFTAKKQLGNWSADEVVRLMTVIEGEDVEDFFALQLSRENSKEETPHLNGFAREIKKKK